MDLLNINALNVKKSSSAPRLGSQFQFLEVTSLSQALL